MPIQLLSIQLLVPTNQGSKILCNVLNETFLLIHCGAFVIKALQAHINCMHS